MFQGRLARQEAVIWFVVVVVSMAAQAPASGFAGGTGQLQDPYQIATAEELILIGSDPNLLSRYFILSADIDLAGRTFSAAVIAPDTDPQAGFDGAAFRGNFNGRGYKVIGLTIDQDKSEGGFLGLFGRVDDVGVVTALGVENVIICRGRVHSVGGLAGDNNGLIRRCYAKGSVSCGDWSDGIGGLVGTNQGTISECYASAEASVGQHGSVAGLAGSNAGVISQCYAAGGNSSAGWYGSLAGLVASNAGVIGQCYTTAELAHGMFNDRAGLALSNAGLIADCYFLSPADGGGPDNGLGTALSRAQMRQADSLAGWDLYGEDTPAGAWFIPDQGYPVLAWQTEVSDLVWLPRVRGAALAEAQAMLAEAGVVLGNVSYDFDVAVPADKVIALHPGHPVARGTVVDVLVSRGVYDWSQNTGDGSIARPYEISSIGQLECMGQDIQLWSKRFVLTGDIDLAGRLYADAVIAPYPNEGNAAFSGSLDGCGYSIIGLTMASARDHVGFFGYISTTGQVRNLTLQDSRVLGRSAVDSASGTGMLAGSNNGLVTDCSASGSVIGGRQVGGLVGRNTSGSVLRCYAAAGVSGHVRVGGLVGYSYGSGSMNECAAAGAVSGTAMLGGLVGAAGGAINRCFAMADVSGTDNLGGLVGFAHLTSSMNQCFALGRVAGQKNVGGLVGTSDRAVVGQCYATGSVSGVENLGGLVGYADEGTISQCYAAGSVSGGINVGGLTGIQSGETTASFWDTETSGLSESASGTGLTTRQMQTAATFSAAGWDLAEDWTICEANDYPHLRWEAVQCSGN